MSSARTLRQNLNKVATAVNSGRDAHINLKDKRVQLRVAGRSYPLTIVKANGDVTKEGEKYYELKGQVPPTIFPYEQNPDAQGFILNFDGSKTRVFKFVKRQGLVVKEPTKRGEDYYANLRDDFDVNVPQRFMREVGDDDNGPLFGFADRAPTYKRSWNLLDRKSVV